MEIYGDMCVLEEAYNSTFINVILHIQYADTLYTYKNIKCKSSILQYVSV